ncbi:MAG: hypothetical protein HND48_12725 [Chloroflexi bacterium]|nr:hypothetical protein [Chloroflexota bacterium]
MRTTTITVSGVSTRGAAVALAETWAGVASETSYDSGTITAANAIQDGPSGAWTTVDFNVTDTINVESVDVWVTAQHASRGQLVFELVSPSGMVSQLMPGRPDNGDDYTNWRFNTVAHWDEFSYGTWTLRVRDAVAGTTGTLNDVRMRIYGTHSDNIVIVNEPSDVTILYDEPAELSVVAAGQSLSAPVVQRHIRRYIQPDRWRAVRSAQHRAADHRRVILGADRERRHVG